MVFWVIVSLANAPSCLGQCEPGWKSGQGIPGVSGGVNAITTWDPDGAGPEPNLIVVGGEFKIAGNVIANNLAAWDGTSWRGLGDFTTVYPPDDDAEVNALAVFNGDLIVGGVFETAGGVTVNNITRFDGTNWYSMVGGISGNWYKVYALLLYQGDLIAGGLYQESAGALPMSKVARWDGSAWYNVGTGYIGAKALCEYNGNLIAGALGKVYSWDGATWTQLGASSLFLESFDPIGVQALEVYNGDLYVGGSIYVGGLPPFQTGVGVGRWNGSAWETLDATSSWLLGRNVYDMAVYDGKLFVSGGHFYSYGPEGPILRSLVSWDGSSWQSHHENLISTSADAMAVIDDNLYVGAGTQATDGTCSWAFSRWDGSDWHGFDPGNAHGISWLIADFTVHEESLIALGSLYYGGTTRLYDVARWDGDSWESAAPSISDESAAGGNTYTSVVSYQGDIIVGGHFVVSEDPLVVYKILRWDGVDWQPMDNGITHYTVNDLVIYNGELIAVGSDGVSQWNGANWTAMGSGITNVSQAMVYGDQLYVSGQYPYPGDSGCVFYWDGANWQLAADPVNEWISAMSFYNGQLVVSGDLSNVGPGFNNIARWNGSNWQPLGDGLDNYAYTLEVYNGDLIAMGSFTAAGGISCNHAARWDGVNWQPMGTGLDTYYYSVNASIIYKGELIAGGGIETADGIASVGWARWGLETPLTGDLNHDCTVNLLDLTQFCSYWLSGNCETIGWCDEADLNYDQSVNLEDFVKLMQNW
ncbi:MAG: hypothetical protein JW709_10120 [Sedimentisphaerales bacterium]|nr:hypothetical protein [Sedimentisphaerales bacterium]